MLKTSHVQAEPFSNHAENQTFTLGFGDDKQTRRPGGGGMVF